MDFEEVEILSVEVIEEDIDVYVLLIYKNPFEIANSFKKRSKKTGIKAILIIIQNYFQ